MNYIAIWCIGLFNFAHSATYVKLGRLIYKPDGHPKPDRFRFNISPVDAGVGLNSHPN
jgi:hypothetical protein